MRKCSRLREFARRCEYAILCPCVEEKACGPAKHQEQRKHRHERESKRQVRGQSHARKGIPGVSLRSLPGTVQGPALSLSEKEAFLLNCEAIGAPIAISSAQNTHMSSVIPAAYHPRLQFRMFV